MAPHEVDARLTLKTRVLTALQRKIEEESMKLSATNPKSFFILESKGLSSDELRSMLGASPKPGVKLSLGFNSGVVAHIELELVTE